MGCASGPNTLSVVADVITIVEKLCKKLNCSSPEYKVFLNDLPENDFNNIFKSLDNFKEKLREEIQTEMSHCYFFGVPGSFYGRVFLDRSLHLVHCSYSLHWLSKVPHGISNNMGNIYISNTSPSNVLKAYYEQFQCDFQVFLKCRAKELVEGGCMVLTMLGRRSDDPCSEDNCYLLESLVTALNDMGIIEEDKMNTFNIPVYHSSPNEVRLEVLNKGSFVINHLEVFEVDSYEDVRDFDNESKMSQSLNYGRNVMLFMRAVFEPLLISHFGETVIEEVFSRHQKILADAIMSRGKIPTTNFTLSLTRKA